MLTITKPIVGLNQNYKLQNNQNQKTLTSQKEDLNTDNFVSIYSNKNNVSFKAGYLIFAKPVFDIVYGFHGMGVVNDFRALAVPSNGRVEGIELTGSEKTKITDQCTSLWPIETDNMKTFLEGNTSIKNAKAGLSQDEIEKLLKLPHINESIGLSMDLALLSVILPHSPRMFNRLKSGLSVVPYLGSDIELPESKFDGIPTFDAPQGTYTQKAIVQNAKGKKGDKKAASIELMLQNAVKLKSANTLFEYALEDRNRFDRISNIYSDAVTSVYAQTARFLEAPLYFNPLPRKESKGGSIGKKLLNTFRVRVAMEWAKNAETILTTKVNIEGKENCPEAEKARDEIGFFAGAIVNSYMFYKGDSDKKAYEEVVEFFQNNPKIGKQVSEAWTRYYFPRAIDNEIRKINAIECYLAQKEANGTLTNFDGLYASTKVGTDYKLYLLRTPKAQRALKAAIGPNYDAGSRIRSLKDSTFLSPDSRLVDAINGSYRKGFALENQVIFSSFLKAKEEDNIDPYPTSSSEARRRRIIYDFVPQFIEGRNNAGKLYEEKMKIVNKYFNAKAQNDFFAKLEQAYYASNLFSLGALGYSVAGDKALDKLNQVSESIDLSEMKDCLDNVPGIGELFGTVVDWAQG